MNPHPLRRRRSITLGVSLLAILTLVLPASVLAHAELDTITPGDGSTVEGSPPEVVATFTEALDASKSSFVVVAAGGAEVASGGEVGADDPKKMTLTLPDLEPESTVFDHVGKIQIVPLAIPRLFNPIRTWLDRVSLHFSLGEAY